MFLFFEYPTFIRMVLLERYIMTAEKCSFSHERSTLALVGPTVLAG